MTTDAAETLSRDALLRMTTQVVSAYVANNPVQETLIQAVIQTVYASLSGLVSAEIPGTAKQTLAVQVKRAVLTDHTLCLEARKKVNMLQRSMRPVPSLTTDKYRPKI